MRELLAEAGVADDVSRDGVARLREAVDAVGARLLAKLDARTAPRATELRFVRARGAV